ncbi:transcriptional regulator BetI [Hypericibacter sp.]|uniref:transcriptional regulator BetI n=1 Tax=Hypericibacter sp. TaxID=2705401 RepID=UPI003D6CDCC9
MKARHGNRPRTHPEINRFRRHSFIAATLKVIAENGIENTTMAKIGEAANVSGALASHYFSSKEDLLIQAYQALFDTVFEEAHRAASQFRNEPVKQIKAIIAAVFGRVAFTTITRGAYLRFWAASLSNPELLKISRKSYQKDIEAIERLMQRAAPDSKDFNARRAALSLVSMMDGFWLDMSFAKNTLTAKLAVELCCQYVDVLLPGSAPSDDKDDARRLAHPAIGVPPT